MQLVIKRRSLLAVYARIEGAVAHHRQYSLVYAGLARQTYAWEYKFVRCALRQFDWLILGQVPRTLGS